MGLIRKGLFFIISLVLFILLLSGNMFLTLSLSLHHEIIKPEINSIVTGLIKEDYPNLEQEIESSKKILSSNCTNKDDILLLHQGEFNIKVPCQLRENTTQEIINYNINEIVNKKYYQDYNCKGFNCFKQGFNLPFFLISKQMKDYYQGKFNLILILMIISIILLLIITEKKTNALITTGILMSLTALPFAKLNKFFSLFSIKYIEYLSVFISQSQKVFWIFFITGLIILGLGILIRIFEWEYHIAQAITKFIDLFKKKKEITS